jgi:regulator of replication initiation timing
MKSQSIKVASFLFPICCLIFGCGPSQEELDTVINNYESTISEKGKELEGVKQSLYNLDTEFGNYQVSSQKERDSLQTFSQNLSNAMKAKIAEITALREKMRTTTSDNLAREYFDELSKKNQQLEELIIEKDNFIATLQGNAQLYEVALDSLQAYHYRFNQLMIRTNQMNENIDYNLLNSESLSDLPTQLINDYKILGTSMDAFTFTANRMSQVRAGYKDLADILEKNYAKLGLRIGELDKKIDKRYFMYGSKKELRDKNILNRNSINTSDLNPYYFKEISRKVNMVKISVSNKRDKPEVLSNHRGYELKQESDLVWNLYIKRPLSFWSNSNYLIIAY